MSSSTRFSKRNILAYSMGLASAIGFGPTLYQLLNHLLFPFDHFFPYELGPDYLWRFVLVLLVRIVLLTLVISAFWLFVRWVASTAERAGRSYSAFMILALIFPPIAWIIVVIFKKPKSDPQLHE